MKKEDFMYDGVRICIHRFPKINSFTAKKGYEWKIRIIDYNFGLYPKVYTGYIDSWGNTCFRNKMGEYVGNHNQAGFPLEIESLYRDILWKISWLDEFQV